MSACERCDFIGPELSSLSAVRELHRAWHEFAEATLHSQLTVDAIRAALRAPR